MRTVFNSSRGILAIAFSIMSAHITNAQVLGKTDDAHTNSIADQIASLEKLDERQREALLRDNGENLHLIQASLLNQIGSANNEVQCYAAYLLGEYRFPGAAVDLSKAIALKARIRPNAREWFWDRYPAAEALAKIGSPSIPALILNLENSDDVLVRDLSVRVISQIESDKEIVKLRLQRALDKQIDSGKRARLRSALKSLLEMKTGG